MNKKLLKSEKSLYELFDEIYNIIKDNDIHKAKYQDKEEQYSYQKTFNFPVKYPCIIIYDTRRDHHCNYQKPYINNKTYYVISNVMIIYPEDFK